MKEDAFARQSIATSALATVSPAWFKNPAGLRRALTGSQVASDAIRRDCEATRRGKSSHCESVNGPIGHVSSEKARCRSLPSPRFAIRHGSGYA